MRPIYLDYNATTPVAPAVRAAMAPYLEGAFGNPSSGHVLGREAARAVEQAREQVAVLIGAAADEIVFTSCGTEANNLALKGLAYRHGLRFRPGVVISALEHPAVTEPAAFLGRMGTRVNVVECDFDGRVHAEGVAKVIDDGAFLVSVIHANNEIGVIQPIAEISQVCRDRKILLHTDAAQSVGKIPVHVDELGVDLLTIAGHKLYAPKGVGALYVRRGVRLEPLLHGAGHEYGLRAGTENVPYIVGLGAAAALAAEQLDRSAVRMAAMRDRLAECLAAGIGQPLHVHGAKAPRLPNTLSIAFPGVTGQELLAATPDVCASTGAACHSGAVKMSATLKAIHATEEQAAGTVRLSLGRETTEAEIDTAAELLIAAWRKLASIA